MSPTVLKLIAHRRKVVVRRVMDEQARLRLLQKQQQQSGSSRNDIVKDEAEALAQFSRERTAFARKWAVLKLLDD